MRSGEMSILRKVCFTLVGLTFFISGILKLQDPVGTSLILQEYFTFFGVRVLIPAAKVLGVMLSFVEALCGVALVVGVWRKIVAVITTVLMVFFTLVTVVLVLLNPVMDCGCFGEAFHLTHFQSLTKNIILDILCAIAFLPLFGSDVPPCKKRKYVAFGMVAVILAFVSFHSLTSLPFVDYTDYAPGDELLGGNTDDDHLELRDTVFIYERNAQSGEFSPNRLPDNTWKRVGEKLNRMNFAIRHETVSVLDIRDAEGIYHNELLVEGDVVIVSSYFPEKLSIDDWNGVSELFQDVQMLGMSPVLLLPDVAAAPLELSDYAFSVDRKTLFALNRSNGGVTWVHDSGIIAKWAKTKIPSFERWETLSKANPWEYSMTHSTRERIRFQALFIYSIAVMLLI